MGRVTWKMLRRGRREQREGVSDDIEEARGSFVRPWETERALPEKKKESEKAETDGEAGVHKRERCIA